MLTEKEYVNGNNVILPNREDETQVKRENLRKKKNGNATKNKLNEKKKKQHINTIKAIAIVFVCGLVVVWRYGVAYNVQKQLTSIKSEQNALVRANDNLRLELKKVNNFKYIEENAESKFGMVKPDNNNVIIADLSKDNFKSHQEENKKSSTFINKIKQLFANN
ncbi:MAG: cell division protein FtsL [Clostridium sp.]|uniref:FtsB family cell division protein n=1 Tax=Clostridium sp. TaxID=1506 RepID=UPI002A8E8792|nr:cell division protein FtsL [Clostridium sp.]MDY5098285.1 cell division protein FtsL [Clostridium sp.]